MTDNPNMPLNGRTGLLFAMLLVVDSLHFVLARLIFSHLSPSVSAFYVLSIAAVEIGAYAILTGRLQWRTLKENPGFFLLIGLLIATSTNINYEAVAFIDPGTATLLAQTGTIWGLLLGIFWLKDKLLPKQVWGALLAVLGVFIITYQAGDYLRLGSLLVLGSAFIYALHAALAKRHSGEMDFISFFFFRVLFTALFLFLFSTARGALQWAPADAWPFLILAATSDVVISRALYYLMLRRLTLSLHTILLTLSPVLTILISLLLFETFPSPKELVGGAVVVAGVLLVSAAARRKTQPA